MASWGEWCWPRWVPGVRFSGDRSRYRADARRSRGADCGLPDISVSLRRSSSWDSRTSARRPKTGRSQLKRITDSKRLAAKLRSVKAELMRRRHQPIPEQGRWLASVLSGHTNYCLPGNRKALRAFRFFATEHWHRALRRRSQHDRLTVATDAAPERAMATVAEDRPPLARSAVRRQNPREEPSELAVHAGICAGGESNPDRRRPVPTAINVRRGQPWSHDCVVALAIARREAT